MGDQYEGDVERAFREAQARMRRRHKSPAPRSPRLHARPEAHLPRRRALDDDGEEKGAAAGLDPEDNLIADAVQERAAWGGVAPMAAAVGLGILRGIQNAVRREDPELLPRVQRRWIAHSQADSIVDRSVNFLNTELAAGDILAVPGPAQVAEAAARQRPTFQRLTRIADAELRNAAALTAHGWALPLILYHHIHDGVHGQGHNHCHETPTGNVRHVKLLRDVMERMRYHVLLFGNAINLGILDPDVPWYQHDLSVVLRLAKHGEFLDRMLELHAAAPHGGIGARTGELKEFDRRATAILEALLESLPTGEVEDPEPQFWRDTERWLKAVDLVAPNWTKWVMPLVQLGAIALPAFLEIMQPVLTRNTPAGLRANAFGATGVVALENDAFNRDVAAELNAHPAKAELIGRMIYSQDNGAHKVYINAKNDTGVSAASLGHVTQRALRAERNVAVRPYPDMLEVGNEGGIGRYVHVNATLAGLHSQFTSVPMAILDNPRLWVACDGLLRAQAEFGAGRTAEAVKMVNTYGAGLTQCVQETLAEARLEPDQYAIVRAFVDFNVGAWMQRIHLLASMPEALALHTAGYLLHHHLGDAILNIPWWADALLPGTPANTMLVTNYLVYWVGRQIAQFKRPATATMNFEEFMWWCIKGYTKATGYWNLVAMGYYHVSYNGWWSVPDLWVVPRYVMSLSAWPARTVLDLVTRFRAEFRARFPLHRGLREWREAALRVWRVSGMDRVFGEMANLDPELRPDYAAGAAALNAAVEAPTVQNVMRIANEIAAAPNATGVPLADFNAAMNHMHAKLERFNVIPTTKVVVEAATGAVIATMVIEPAGVLGAALVTQHLISEAYARVPVVQGWRSYLGSRIKALPKLLGRSFARCVGRRAPRRIPTAEEDMAFEGPVEALDYAERNMDPAFANQQIERNLQQFIETCREERMTDLQIDRELERQGDPFVLNMWRTKFYNRGRPVVARAPARDLRAEIQRIVTSNRRLRVPRAEIRGMLDDIEEYRVYLREFDEGAFD